jgi:hypothetical protein
MPLPIAGLSGNFCLKSRALHRPVRLGKQEAVQPPQPHSPTLAPPNPRHKAQDWCSSTAILFKLWTLWSNSDWVCS